MASVLITRPQATALPLAEKLRLLGYETAIEPLLDIAPLGAAKPETKDIDAVMVTSGNALDMVDPAAIAGLARLPCFCVGPRTGQKARAMGFSNVQNSGQDGAALAALIGNLLRQNGAILHIAGEDADSRARRELERQGRRVVVWEVYKAIPVMQLSAAAVKMIAEGKIGAILVFSPRTAETLAALMTRHALNACCVRLAAICLSEAVAAPLEPLGWHALVSAAAPTEDAMIACLQETVPARGCA